MAVATAPIDRSFKQFHDWLVSQGKAARTVRTNVQYAKHFGSVLDTGDMSSLSTSLPGTRSKKIALVALANLAKFQGRYERFQELKKRYALKWSTTNSTQYFQRFFDEGLTLDVMLQRIRKMIKMLPERMATVIKFNMFTGLRPTEAIESIRLLNSADSSPRYFNEERQCLEHYKFPQFFLRTTKKAYLSYLSTDMYQWITKNRPSTPTLNAITLACRRKGVKMEMYLCRKVFASHLRQEGIQPEVVDMLQGRVSPSVLTRHYLVPAEGLKDQVLEAVHSLNKRLNTNNERI